MPDDSLTGHLGRSRRRKMRNQRGGDLVPGADGITGGAVDPDGDLPEDGGASGDDCEGGLLGCRDSAGEEVCSPNSSGDYERQVGCVVDVVTAKLSPGDTVAWAADLKLTSGTEVNPDGTLKMTNSGLLYRDALDTLGGVTIENGTAEILNGKLHLPAGTNNDVRFTGATNRNQVVAQIRVQGSMNPSGWSLARFAARATGSLDAYVGQYAKFQDTLDRFVGGVFDAQLDSEDYLAGLQRLSGERTVIKIYTADGVQKLKMSTDLTDQTYQMSATDTDLNSQTGRPAFISTSANQPTIAWDLIQCPNDDLTCSGLPTGHKVRVGTRVAVETAGTAVLDMGGTIYPSPFPLEVLDASNNVLVAWMPDAGFFGGAVFEYSAGGAFTPDDAAGQIDLDISSATGTLLATATTGSTWDQPAWKRFTGTVQLPEGAAFLAPMMRRTGTDSAVLCSRRVVVRAGTSAPWVPCPDEVVSDNHVVPTDEKKVLDLRFTDKHAKINATANSFDEGVPKDDTDGTIKLSRRVFDSSIYKFHHRIETDSRWAVGPDGGALDPNPDGDFVGDWPEPHPGIRGWALRSKTFTSANDYGMFVSGYNPTGIIVYDAPDVASIRGPLDEYNKMHGFTYFFWWQPAIETFWDHNLASVYHPTQNVEDNVDLGEVFNRERAGWRFVYSFDPADNKPHLFWIALELEDNFYAVAFESDHGGPGDPFFGEAADLDLQDDGNNASTPAFIALRFGEQRASDAATPITHGHTGAGGASVFLDGTTDYAQSFVAPATGVISHVTLTMRQGDAGNYSPNTDSPWIQDTLRARIWVVPDNGGEPGTSAEDHYGSVAAAAMPTSAESPEAITVQLAYSAPITEGQTYWIVAEGRHADDSPLSVFGLTGSLRVEVFGTDPGDDAGGSAVSGSHPGSWSAATIDLDYEVTGIEPDGATIPIDVWVGNPRTGVLNKMGAAQLTSEHGITPGQPADFLSNHAVPVPRAFTEDNSTQPVYGALTQNRDDSLNLQITWSGASAGILSAAVRHNRACSDVEVLGAFIAGYRHEYEAASSLFEADVDNQGEGAQIVLSP